MYLDLFSFNQRSVKNGFQLVVYCSLKYIKICTIPVEVPLEQAGWWLQQKQLQIEHSASGVEPYAPQKENHSSCGEKEAKEKSKIGRI